MTLLRHPTLPKFSADDLHELRRVVRPRSPRVVLGEFRRKLVVIEAQLEDFRLDIEQSDSETDYEIKVINALVPAVSNCMAYLHDAIEELKVKP
ncbi:MAG TPA: hypothetical protein VKV73_26275 [Chloroflexota bacterium]|nr:hypothetical protein [Chloroflexota bacterium]